MKLALPMDENKKDICVSFGRAPFFMLFDTETGEEEFFENDGAEAESGSGIKAGQLCVNMGADAVITTRCGENSALVLKEAEIKIYKSSVKDARENINLFNKGELSELLSFYSGFIGIM